MKTFYVGIKGVIVKDGKVLIMRSPPPEHYWEMPGGRIDQNETITEALTRELKEEIPNIKNIQVGRVLSAYRLQKDVKPDTSLVLIFYEVSADFDGEVQMSHEHDAYKWATKEEALAIAEEASQAALQHVFETV